jgi:predicted glycoside hydrolase/deacetylase ChbG (UPF0249 family)
VTLVGEPWGTDGRVVAGWRELVKQIIARGRGMREAVAREVEWQADQCAGHGLRLHHIDSHQHVHAFGGVWQPVLEAARTHGIGRVRVPWCPSWKIIKKNVGGIALQALSGRLARRVRDRLGQGFLPILGVAHAGHNTPEIYAREFALVNPDKARDVELCVHPGVNTPDLERRYGDWRFDWTGERDALLSGRFRETLVASGYELAAGVPAAPGGHVAATAR